MFHTFSASGSAQTSTASSSGSPATCLPSCVKKSPQTRAWFSPPGSEQTLRRFTPPKLRVAHSERTRKKSFLRSCVQAERSTADPTVRSSNRRRHAPSSVCLHSLYLSLLMLCCPSAWPPGGDKLRDRLFRRNKSVCDTSTFFTLWSPAEMLTVYSPPNVKTYSTGGIKSTCSLPVQLLVPTLHHIFHLPLLLPISS